MGRWGNLVLVSFATLALLNPIANASIAAQMLALAAMGITERQVNDDYAKRLNIDPRVTVPIVTGDDLCTGTFLSPTILVTAAHCPDLNHETGGINVDGIDSLKVYFLDLYSDKTDDEEVRYDLAIVEFPPGTGDFLGIKKYPTLAEAPPEEGDKIYLPAFGMNNVFTLLELEENSGVGIKGWGTAIISVAKNGLFLTKPVIVPSERPAPGKEIAPEPNTSNALPGDSGGAIYNELGQIVGITSVVKLVSEKTEQVPSRFGGPVNETKTLTWRMLNKFADVTGHEFSDLLSRATGCGDGTHFSVSLTPKNAVKKVGPFAALEVSKTTSPFSHVVLRTGSYSSEKDRAKQLYLHPHYANKKITKVFVAEWGESKSPDVLELFCREDRLCIDSQGKKMVAFKKDMFLVYELLRDKDVPDKFHGKLIDEYAFNR